MLPRELYISPRHRNLRLKFSGRDLALSVVNTINATRGAGPQDQGYLWVRDLQPVFFRDRVCILVVLLRLFYEMNLSIMYSVYGRS